MTTDSSATALEQTPHEIEITSFPISDATRRRAQVVINHRTIDLAHLMLYFEPMLRNAQAEYRFQERASGLILDQ